MNSISDPTVFLKFLLRSCWTVEKSDRFVSSAGPICNYIMEKIEISFSSLSQLFDNLLKDLAENRKDFLSLYHFILLVYNYIFHELKRFEELKLESLANILHMFLSDKEILFFSIVASFKMSDSKNVLLHITQAIHNGRDVYNECQDRNL